MTDRNKELDRIILGMGESVTPHAQMSEPVNWEHLTSGIDTLDVGIRVNWSDWQWLSERLAIGKAKAIQKRNSFLEIGINELKALPTGKAPMYQYGIATPDYRMWIADRQEPANFPNVFVSPLSKSLWTIGVKGIVDLIIEHIAVMKGDIESITPSRLDVCVDFHVPGGISEQWIDKHIVSRADKVRKHLDKSTLQTFYVGGLATSIQMRIYDKSVEVRNSGKTWMQKVWQTDCDEDVWRIEFQLRREVLREFNMESISDVRDGLRSLWSYLTEKWFSLRETDSEHTSRRTVCPFWEAVQAAGLSLEGQMEVERKPIESHSDVRQLIRQILGCVKSYAAHRRVVDLPACMRRLKGDLAEEISPKAFTDDVRSRAVDFGIHLGEEDRP